MNRCYRGLQSSYAPHSFHRENASQPPANIIVHDKNGKVINFSTPSSIRQHRLQTETVWDVPHHMGNGHFLKVELGNGLWIAFGEIRLKNHLWENVYDENPGVTLIACLKGSLNNRNDCFRNGFDLPAGTGALCFSPDPNMTRQSRPGEIMRKFIIKIPLDRIDRLFDNRQLERAVDHERPFLADRRLSAGMQATILQTINCPFQDSARLLYLEGKTLELISHWVCDDASGGPSSLPLKPDETERIWHAHDLLLQDFRNPPSLMALSKTVGLTHTRLNDGFKTLFGHTVFDWLRIQRLEKARQLILEGRKNMTEIAYEIGFASSSHFALAFRKFFGMPPSRYRT